MNADRAGLARWWHGLGRGQQVFTAVVALVVMVNVTLSGTRSILGGDPGGPVSSSFSTGSDGLEAYADLADAAGHPVDRQRESVAEHPPSAGATLVVADPVNLSGDDVDVFAGFLAGGGRMVVAGESAAELVGALTGAPLRWRSAGPVDEVQVWLAVDSTGTARTLGGDRGGRWADVGDLVPVAGVSADPVVVTGRAGQGVIVAIADAGLIQNASLAADDNAALALAALGPVDRPAVFVESVHGFDRSGLAAVPPSWKWAGAGLLLAMVAGLWSAGTRFGPAEPLRRELRPARQDHVDAVAAGMDRVARDPAVAAGPLAERARRHLAAELATETDAAPAVLHAAAVRAGSDPSEIAVLVSPPEDLSQALLVGAAAARHQRRLRRSSLADTDRLAESPVNTKESNS